jgi:hypothetical protein
MGSTSTLDTQTSDEPEEEGDTLDCPEEDDEDEG